MRIAYVMSASVLFVGIAGCIAEKNTEPPGAAVVIEDVTIPIKMEAFTWEQSGHAESTVLGSPSTLLLMKELPYTEVQPGTEISVEFQEPPYSLHAGLWEDGEIQSEVKIGRKVFAPTHRGNHIIVLRAEWRDGEVLYAFPIKVK